MSTDRSADRHGAPRRAYQLPDDEWEEFGRRVEAAGTNRATVATELVRWWNGARDEPPPRPPSP